MAYHDTIANVTTVAASTSTVVLLNAQPGDIHQRLIFNASTAVLYVKFGDQASTSLYTTQVGPNALFEFPGDVYDGLVTGVWATAAGAAMCTEVG